MKLEEFVQYCKMNGFIYQGSEIYGGLANTWDYAPLGALLKQNIKKAWINKFVNKMPGNVLLDGPILLNPRVWEASGHVKSFSDPLIECKSCNQRFRADKLIFDFNGFDVDGMKNEQIQEYVENNHIKCPNCEEFKWAEIKNFNMMFQTYQGVILDKSNQIYLRPETAQNIFIQFKNILRTSRSKLPFGICQVGKSFRNEITPGNFIFRTREFEQMEMEYFVKPGTELEVFKNLKQYCMDFLLNLGVKAENLIFNDHKEEALSFYSNATTDIQYRFPWGFDELWGIASRTDYDLKQHQEYSGIDLTYLDPETNQRYLAYCVEPSVGVERLVFTFLHDSLVTEKLENDERQVLKIHPYLAPYKACILPLNKKQHMPKVMEIYDELANYFDITIEESGSIGKRYRRQDMIGTPYCITVDFDTETTGEVTVRDRDTMQQERVKVENLKAYLDSKIKL